MSKSMRGTYYHNVDAKGRVIVPVKFREALGKEFVMALGLEECLCLYSVEEWDNFTEKLDGLGDNKTFVRDIKRYFQSSAEDCEIDNQGRTLIPQTLRNELNIGKEVVIIGNGRKAEIWNKAEWEKQKGNPLLNRASLKQKLDDSDINF